MADAFCCDTEWDETCVNQVADHCPDACTGTGGGNGQGGADMGAGGAPMGAGGGGPGVGGGGNPAPCDHDPCTTGGCLDPACDPCVSQICAADPYCCSSAWDSICVDEVESICGQTCGGGAASSSASSSTGAGAGGGGPGGCAHDTCVTGEALDPACDPCASAVCAVDPYCCNVEWDSICVDEVDANCATPCRGGTGGAGGGDPGTGGADNGGAGFGQPCVSNAGCASNLCFNFMAKGQLCSLSCQSDADCPPPSTGCNGMGVCKVP
jgi:hypothetical protein